MDDFDVYRWAYIFHLATAAGFFIVRPWVRPWGLRNRLRFVQRLLARIDLTQPGAPETILMTQRVIASYRREAAEAEPLLDRMMFSLIWPLSLAGELRPRIAYVAGRVAGRIYRLGHAGWRG